MKNYHTKSFVCLIFMVLSVGKNFAADLPLAVDKLNKVENACPECFENGVMVCGNADIGFGRRFAGNFFQGIPSKGFFVTPPYLSSEFRSLIRNERDHNRVNLKVYGRFKKMKLIVVSESFDEISVLSDPQVEVVIPEQLHSCLIDQNKKWGCGVSENRELECCEKGLGSPVVIVVWADKKNKEIIELSYIPSLGSTKLVRRINDKMRVIYYCQTSETGRIRVISGE